MPHNECKQKNKTQNPWQPVPVASLSEERLEPADNPIDIILSSPGLWEACAMLFGG